MSSLRLRFSLACALAALAGVCAAAGGACKPGGAGGTGAGGGTGGAGGCPTQPEPLLTITVRAQDGPLPPDIAIRVTWSAGEEPVFKLDEPSSWKTLEEANLVCDVDPSAPPPTDLAALSCQLWTNGPAAVEIKAEGYVTFEETLTPEMSEVCEAPVPKHVDIEITRDADAGPP